MDTCEQLSAHSDNPAVTIALRGISRSGKTHWMLNYCRSVSLLWPRTPIRLVVFVSPVENSSAVEELREIFPNTTVRVEQRLDDHHLTNEYLGDAEDGLAIMLLDDLGSQLHNNKPLEQLFIAASSHKSVLAILSVHSFYESSSPSFRTTIHNACYLVTMQDARASSQLSTLSRQLFNDSKFLPACLHDQQHHHTPGMVGAHIIVDCRVECNPKVRVFANILPGDKHKPVAYSRIYK